MSGSTILPAYQFASRDRIDVRRYLGYPTYGTGIVLFPEPWFFRYYLALEARLNNITADEAKVVLNYLATLRGLEAAIPAASANLDTDQAAVWFHNKNEVKDRMSLYRTWRMELCNFLGIPPGPNFPKSGIRVVV